MSFVCPIDDSKCSNRDCVGATCASRDTLYDVVSVSLMDHAVTVRLRDLSLREALAKVREILRKEGDAGEFFTEVPANSYASGLKWIYEKPKKPWTD